MSAKEASARVNWHTVKIKRRKIDEAKKLIIRFGFVILVLIFIVPWISEVMRDVAFSYDPMIDVLLGCCFKGYLLGFGYGGYKLIEAYQIDIYEDVEK